MGSSSPSLVPSVRAHCASGSGNNYLDSPSAAALCGGGAQSRDPIVQLAQLLFGDRWRTSLLLMLGLGTFFDESESQDPRDVFVLAGCISTAERWGRFAKAWTARLKEDGLPYWNTSKSRARKRPFQDLTPERRDVLVDDLVDLMVGGDFLCCALQGFPLEAYNWVFRHGGEIPVHNEVLRLGHDDPYYFAFLSCLGFISRARKSGLLPDERCDGVFEQRDPKRDHRLQAEYERVRHEHFPGEFGPLVPGAKTDPEAIPCQAADLIASEVMRNTRAMIRGESPPPNPLQKLVDAKKLYGGNLLIVENFAQFVREWIGTDVRMRREGKIKD